MEEKKQILNELREIAPKLASLEKRNAYQAPDGYFMAFSSEILQKVHFVNLQAELETVAPVLSKIEKVTDVVPADYFSSFSGSLIQKIKATEVKNELAEIAPTLSKLEKVNAIQVPANYFQSFPEEILAKTKPAKQIESGGVTSLLNKLLDGLSDIIFKPRYAVAFSGFATVLIIAVMMFSKTEQCNDLDCKMAQLSNDEIDTYLSSHPDVSISSDIIFDQADENSLKGIENKNVHPFKEALQDVDDATLNEAMQD